MDVSVKPSDCDNNDYERKVWLKFFWHKNNKDTVKMQDTLRLRLNKEHEYQNYDRYLVMKDNTYSPSHTWTLNSKANENWDDKLEQVRQIQQVDWTRDMLSATLSLMSSVRKSKLNKIMFHVNAQGIKTVADFV